MNEKALIIFDTDMDTDCDDAGALLMLVNAHIANAITLSGVIADSVCEYSAPFCKKVLDYYNLDIPVGEVYGHVNNEERFTEYLKHQKATEYLSYNKVLSKRENEFCDSTKLYTSLLEKSPDNGTTVLCVGMLTAIYEAMKVNRGLFEKKVKHIVIMGNPYKRNDFNFSMDAEATRGFFEICPCPVYVSYLGRDIITGNHLDKSLPIEHPVREAYQIWSGTNGRSSWDLIAALFAINPSLNAFKIVDNCRIEYRDNEKITLLKRNGTRDSIIGLNCTNNEMEDILNGFLV